MTLKEIMGYGVAGLIGAGLGAVATFATFKERLASTDRGIEYLAMEPRKNTSEICQLRIEAAVHEARHQCSAQQAADSVEFE